MSINDSTNSTPSQPTARPLPPFSLRKMTRQLEIDRVLWWIFKLALAGLLIYALTRADTPEGNGIGLMVMLLVFIGLWLAYGTAGIKVARELPRITELADLGQPEAEPRLAVALARRPLQRSLRLLLYHRMAMLRYRQRRLQEAAAVCHAVLQYDLGSARSVRAHLLLMLTEAQLLMKDYWGAWQSLQQLHGCWLSLGESLQRLAWQTRYEVETGHYAAAVRGVDQKIAMAELMPAPHCGILHAQLAHAAAVTDLHEKAAWLRRRAELLCTPEQLQAFPFNSRSVG